MKNQNSKGKIQKITAVHAVLLLPFYFLLFNCAAQQTLQYSQFMLNNYGLNPAACGLSSNRIEVLTGFRRQWIGFPQAPTSAFMNMNVYLGRKGGGLNRGWHGVGAYWQSDQAGEIIKTSDFYGSYTYHLRMTRKYYAAFGLAAGMRRYRFGISEISDPVLRSNLIWLYPDFIPGVKFYTGKWTFDLSVKQLYKFKAKQGENQSGSPSKLSPHVYFSAYHKWWARTYLLVIQSVHVKYHYSSLPSVDLNMLAFLNKNFAVGASYRHMDAVVAMVQFRYDKLVVGLSYDYTIAPYRIGFANSQEYMLGIAPSPWSESQAQQYRTAECPTFQY